MITPNLGYGIGSYAYDFSVKCKEETIPYQLSFDRDLHYKRTNVVLLNFLTGDDNVCFNDEIRKIVSGCILDFCKKEPLENIYFQIDLSHKRNLIKFLKFYRWSLMFPKFNFSINITEREEILYAEVTISQI